MAEERTGRKAKVVRAKVDTGGELRKAPSRQKDRAPRDGANETREDEGDSISMAEREAMLRDEYMQNQLPTPPKKPGVHWFWGSMNNKYTPISWYLKLGYRPVRIDELPGFADATLRLSNGEYSGCIGCNEMVLLKVSDAGYQQIMRKIHHERAGEEVGRIGHRVQETKEAVGQDKEDNDLVTEIGDGFKHLERMARSNKRPRTFQ